MGAWKGLDDVYSGEEKTHREAITKLLHLVGFNNARILYSFMYCFTCLVFIPLEKGRFVLWGCVDGLADNL